MPRSMLRVARAVARYDRARKAQRALIESWEARDEADVGFAWDATNQGRLQQQSESDAQAMDPLTDEETAAWDEMFTALRNLEDQQ